MNLEAIVNYLEKQELVEIGYSPNRRYTKPIAFANTRPPAKVPHNLITVLFVEPLTGTPINHYTPGYLRGRFQAIVSSSDIKSGRAMAEKILKELTLYNVSVSEEILVKQCLPEHEPVPFPKTEGNEVEHLVTFQIHYVKTQ